MAAGGPRGPREAAGIPQTPQPGQRGIQTLGHIPGQSLALPLNRSAATEISKSSWERGWRVWIHPGGHKSTASHQQRAFPLRHPRMVTKSFHLIPFPVLIPHPARSSLDPQILLQLRKCHSLTFIHLSGISSLLSPLSLAGRKPLPSIFIVGNWLCLESETSQEQPQDPKKGRGKNKHPKGGENKHPSHPTPAAGPGLDLMEEGKAKPGLCQLRAESEISPTCYFLGGIL